WPSLLAAAAAGRPLACPVTAHTRPGLHAYMLGGGKLAPVAAAAAQDRRLIFTGVILCSSQTDISSLRSNIGMRRELRAIVQPELVENVVQMHLHGAFGEPELARDLFVRKRLCDERRDFALPQR